MNRHQEFLNKKDTINTINSTVINYTEVNGENDTSSVKDNSLISKNIWPSNTCVIVGDSIINGIDEKKI